MAAYQLVLRTAQRTVLITLGSDPSVTLNLIDTGNGIIGKRIGLASAELTCAATALSRLFGFYNLRHITILQPGTSQARQVPITAICSAESCVADKADPHTGSCLAGSILIANLIAVDTAVGRQNSDSRHIKRTTDCSGGIGDAEWEFGEGLARRVGIVSGGPDQIQGKVALGIKFSHLIGPIVDGAFALHNPHFPGPVARGGHTPDIGSRRHLQI